MLPPTCVWDVVFRHETCVPDSRVFFVEQRNPVSIHGELFPHRNISTRFRGSGSGASGLIKNVDFLVFLRVLRQIVLFGFLLRGTDHFCCVK